jgi:hypothetical protein
VRNLSPNSGAFEAAFQQEGIYYHTALAAERCRNNGEHWFAHVHELSLRMVDIPR